MKRTGFLKHLRRYGCVMKREGANHSLWINLNSGVIEAIPRHNEIPEKLIYKICKNLGIPKP